MFFRVLMIGALAAAGAGADVMTLHWGDPALPEDEAQGLLYWTNTTTPPTLPLTDAELTPDDGPNAGQNLLRKNADKTWEVSVNLPGNPENGGTGFIVLSWNGQTPIVVRQNADWSLQATWVLDATIQQQSVAKGAKTDLPLPNMLSKSNSYLYLGTDFREHINNANVRLGTEWPNESGSPLELLGAWVVRNNNGFLSTRSQGPYDETCINIGASPLRITVRLDYDASQRTLTQWYGLGDDPVESVLKHKYNVAPPEAEVDLRELPVSYKIEQEDDTFNLKVRGYATRSLGPIILTGDVISGLEPAEGEGEGQPEGQPEGGGGEGEGEGEVDGEIEPMTECPDFDTLGYQFFNQLLAVPGCDWNLTDEDGNGMIDSWEVAVFSEVLCNPWYPLNTACVQAFQLNRAVFLAEPGIPAAHRLYADVAAALLSVSSELRQALVAEWSLTGVYQVAHGSGVVGAEPFSAQGNPDRDAASNFLEYVNIMNLGLPRKDYVIVALDPRMNGTTPPSELLPVTGGFGLGTLCLAVGLGGLAAYRHRRPRKPV
jgi:hypothetical protein